MGDFLERITNIKNPEIEKGIASGDPYVICDLLETTRGGIYLKDLENAIINTGDIVQIYEFLFLAVDMQIPEFDTDRFERIIRESNNPKLMCYCMGFVPGTNLEEMMKALIETHNTKYLAMLLNNEEYKEALETARMMYPNYEEIVEESKKHEFFPRSLADFKEFEGNIQELKSRILKAQNPHLITELANYIEYLNEFKGGSYDISDLTKAQEELKDPMQCYEYLASVDLEEKGGLIDSVIDSKRPKFMYYVHEYVPNLTDEERKRIEDNILKIDPKGKYGSALEDGTGEIMH